jgi:hypothetical protein
MWCGLSFANGSLQNMHSKVPCVSSIKFQSTSILQIIAFAMMEYVKIITQIDPVHLKFCDKKHLKGRELFS